LSYITLCGHEQHNLPLRNDRRFWVVTLAARENKLHELVCHGILSLEEAQQDVSANWIEAYKKYVSPE